MPVIEPVLNAVSSLSWPPRHRMTAASVDRFAIWVRLAFRWSARLVAILRHHRQTAEVRRHGRTIVLRAVWCASVKTSPQLWTRPSSWTQPSTSRHDMIVVTAPLHVGHVISNPDSALKKFETYQEVMAKRRGLQCPGKQVHNLRVSVHDLLWRDPLWRSMQIDVSKDKGVGKDWTHGCGSNASSKNHLKGASSAKGKGDTVPSIHCDKTGPAEAQCRKRAADAKRDACLRKMSGTAADERSHAQNALAAPPDHDQLPPINCGSSVLTCNTNDDLRVRLFCNPMLLSCECRSWAAT